jgi:hypothetical protein
MPLKPIIIFYYRCCVGLRLTSYFWVSDSCQGEERKPPGRPAGRNTADVNQIIVQCQRGDGFILFLLHRYIVDIVEWKIDSRPLKKRRREVSGNGELQVCSVFRGFRVGLSYIVVGIEFSGGIAERWRRLS